MWELPIVVLYSLSGFPLFILLRARLCTALFEWGACLSGQTVILLNIPDHIHALLIGERTELFQKAFHRVLLVWCTSIIS